MSAYEMMLAELLRGNQPAPPQFTPDQVRQRIRTNNDQMSAGLVGMLAGEDPVSGVGGQIFKKSMAAREPRITNRGTTDPLTGETALDPAYVEQQQEAKRGRVLQLALNYEGQRTSAQEKADLARQRAEDRAELARLTASLRQPPVGRAAPDPEMVDLNKQLKQAQIDALTTRRETAENKALAGQQKAALLARNASTRAGFLAQQVEEAEKAAGAWTAGPLGSQLRKIPGTPAYNLQAKIDTIKANIGFTELQQMRQESPTGGALGQVAIRELEMLQATLGNLDTAQSPGQLKAYLAQIKQHFKNIQADMDTIRPELPPTPGATDMPAAGSGSTPVQPMPGAAPSGGAAPRPRIRVDANGNIIR